MPDNAFLFRWDFVVPEDSNATDAELLERAAKLSRHSEFRDSRRRFHEWRRRLIANHTTVDVARAEMNRCLGVINDVVDKSRMHSRALTALQVIAAAVPLEDLTHPGVGMAGGVAFGLGAILADKFIPSPQMGEREKIGALVHDSRVAFGWQV
jgi:hypothetical protein